MIRVCDKEDGAAALGVGGGIGEEAFLGRQQAGALGPAHKLVQREVERVLAAQPMHILRQLRIQVPYVQLLEIFILFN